MHSFLTKLFHDRSAKPQQHEDGQMECRAMHGRGMIGRGIILKAFLLIPLPNIPLPNFPELGCGWPRCAFAPLR
jgi:hypothetical protein